MNRASLVTSALLLFACCQSALGQMFTPFERFTPLMPFNGYAPPRYYVRPYVVMVPMMPPAVAHSVAHDRSFRLRFDKGNDFYAEMTSVMSQKTRLLNQDIKQTQEQIFVLQVQPAGKTADGDWLVRLRIVGIRLKVNIGGNVVEFDSAQPKQKGPVAEYFKDLMSADFKAVIRPGGSVRKVDGVKEVLARLANAAHPQLHALAGPALRAQITQMAASLCGPPPKADAKLGDHWTDTTTSNLGLAGQFNVTKTYAYAAVGTRPRVDFTISLAYVPGTSELAHESPFTVEDLKLNDSYGKGHLVFDAERGRLLEAAQSITLNGLLRIRIGGAASVVDLQETRNLRVRTFEK